MGGGEREREGAKDRWRGGKRGSRRPLTLFLVLYLYRSQAPTSSAEVEVETLSLNSCLSKRPGQVQRSPQRVLAGERRGVVRELSEPRRFSCPN